MFFSLSIPQFTVSQLRALCFAEWAPAGLVGTGRSLKKIARKQKPARGEMTGCQ